MAAEYDLPPCPVEVAEAQAALPILRAAMQPAPVDKAVKALGFILTLVAPTGMGEGERKDWIKAAAWTMTPLPEDILTEAVKLAAREADHPAKALPAIERIAKPILAERKAHLARAAAMASYVPPMPQPKYGPSDEFGKILKEAGLSLKAKSAPTATVDDYVEMGLSREEAEQAVKQHTAQGAR